MKHFNSKIYLYVFSALILIIPGISTIAAPLGYSIKILESSANRIICEIAFDSITVIQKRVENTWFSELSLPGCAFTERENLPKLPIISLALGIPQRGDPMVTVLNQRSISRDLGKIVPVVKPAAAESDEDLFIIPEAASLPQVWPETIAEKGVVGIMRSQRIMQIELHPVRFYLETGLTLIIQSLRLQIDMQHSATAVNRSSGTVKNMVVSEPQFEPYYQHLLANYAESKAWRTVNTDEQENAVAANPETAPFRYKLLVEHDGIYGVTGKELAAIGADLNTITLSTLALFNKGKPVPILVEGEADGVFDPQDRIIFMGEHNSGDSTYLSLFSETNVYWLTWGSGVGARFAEMSGAAGSTTLDTLTSRRTRIHLEKDLLYDRLVSMPKQDQDHWLWQLMQEGREYSFPIVTDGWIKNNTVRIQAGFQGLTHPLVAPDHHILLSLNQSILGELIWDDQNPGFFDTGYININTLESGNTIAINVPGDLPGVSLDRIYLNWLDIEFERSLSASNDTLTFYNQAPDKNLLRISGFTTPEIYILTNAGTRITDYKQIHTPQGYDFLFVDHSPAPVSFMAAGKKRIDQVKRIVAAETTSLKNLNNGADYILITHSNFKPQAQRLVDFRAASGLRTMMVDVQHVFDEFSHGIYDPRAIKRFLRYTCTYWQKPAPLYVLLFGDTTHMLDKALARRDNFASFIPTMMEYTQTWGMSSSDNYFAAVIGDDDMPDLFIGRLPVNTLSEAQVVVDKTIEHESFANAGEWRRNLLMLTGLDNYFEESVNHLYKHYIPTSMVTNRVATLDTSRYFGSTETLTSFFNAGQTLVNFVGHGGGGVFSDAELFQLEDIARLNNQPRYPVIFSLTCFIGHFDNPEGPSLAEELLSTPGKGIVGSFGSSGRAYMQGDFYLNNAIFDVIFHQQKRTMGAIATLGKLEMIKLTRGFWDHVKSYNVLGDPAVPVYIPDDKVTVQLSANTLTSGNQLIVTGSVTGQSQGDLIISAYNDRDSLLVSKQVKLENNAFSISLITLNSQTRQAWGQSGGKGIVRAYFKNNQAEAVGSATFSVDKPYISSLYTLPENPRHQEEFYFVATINQADLNASVGQIDSLLIRWSQTEESWYAMGLVASDNYWRTPGTLKLSEGTTLYYHVAAMVNNNLIVLSDTRQFRVGYRPDLWIDPASVKVFGDNQTFITATIKNRGLSASGSFLVTISINTDSGYTNIASPLNITGLGANADMDAAFLWPGCTPGRHEFVLQVDVNNQVNEQDESNNRTTRTVYIATMNQGSQGELYPPSNRFYVNIPAAAVNKNTSVELAEIQNSELRRSAESCNLTLIPAPGDSLWWAYQIHFADSSIVAGKPVTIAAFYDPDDSLTAYYAERNTLKIFIWNPDTRAWQGVAGTENKQEHYVQAQMPSGYHIFALMSSNDLEPPQIKISLAGQHFANGDLVSSRPVFTIAVQDSGGVDTGIFPVQLALNGTVVSQDEVMIFQNQQTRSQVTVTWTPELTTGNHNLNIQAWDISGNSTIVNASFSISGEFSLAAIANHPNPFATETVIAFTLTDMADKVLLDIYTVSGRRIRSFTFIDLAGYIEQDWDGLDDDGNEVANGVYYLKFTAQKGNKKIETIEKMAKLK